MQTEPTTTDRPAFALELYLAEDGAGHMTFGDELPARYRHAGDTFWAIEESVDAALERAFREANIGAPYVGPSGVWVASYRNRDRARSLSLGDAIVVNGEAGFVVARCGFRPMTDEEREVLAASR